MEIDISDILAEVSRPPRPGTTTSSGRGRDGDFLSFSFADTDTDTADTDGFSDHQLLTRAWTSERCAPDLLPYPTELMGRVMARVQGQISRIEDLASSGGGGDGGSSSTSDTYTSGNQNQNQTNGIGHHNYHYHHNNSKGPNGSRSGSGTGTQNTNLILSILQTDLSRTQFLVRSFLRQRLAKLTKYAGWYLAQLQAQRSDRAAAAAAATATTATRYLSPAETQFLQAHQALLSDLYGSSFLGAFPPALRRLDDATGGVPMLEPPDAATAVVVRCLVDGVWSNERDIDVDVDRSLDPNTTGNGEGSSSASASATVELRMRRGEVWLVRWRDVRGGVERGELDLL